MRTVHIYSGSLALVSKSGVGQAAKHQRAALESVGVHVVTDWDCRAEVVHINTVLPVSLWAARHARRRGQKVIWYGHSTEKDFRNSFTGSNLLAPLFKQWLRLCYNQADLIITPTPTQPKNWQVTVCARPSCRFPTAWIPGFLPPTPPAGPSCGKSTAWRRISPWSSA